MSLVLDKDVNVQIPRIRTVLIVNSSQKRRSFSFVSDYVDTPKSPIFILYFSRRDQ